MTKRWHIESCVDIGESEKRRASDDFVVSLYRFTQRSRRLSSARKLKGVPSRSFKIKIQYSKEQGVISTSSVFTPFASNVAPLQSCLLLFTMSHVHLAKMNWNWFPNYWQNPFPKWHGILNPLNLFYGAPSQRWREWRIKSPFEYVEGAHVESPQFGVVDVDVRHFLCISWYVLLSNYSLPLVGKQWRIYLDGWNSASVHSYSY